MRLKGVIIFLLLLFAGDLLAQSFYARKRNRKFAVSGGLGYSAYLGELTNPWSYFDTKHNIDLGVKYRLHPNFMVRSNVLWFRMSGDDFDIDPERGTHVRNLRFESDNIEFNLMGEYNLFPVERNIQNRSPVNPYITAGIGLMWFSPRAPIPETFFLEGELVQTADYLSSYSPGDMVNLRPLNTERLEDGPYAPFAFVIPIGVGVKFKVTDFLDIALEATGRITFTDYLDDISRRDYPDQSEFDWQNSETEFVAMVMSRPSTGRGLRIRGNPDSNDYYMIFNVKIDYYLPAPSLDRIFGKNSPYGNRQSRKPVLFQSNRRRR